MPAARRNKITGRGELFRRAGASKVEEFRTPMKKAAKGNMADGRNTAVEIILRIMKL
jgi:hypothetical protein